MVILTRSRSVALSGDAPVVKLSKYLPTVPETHNIAVFVGAMARGRDDFADGIVDEKIGISEYPLSASVACGKVCNGALGGALKDTHELRSSVAHWKTSGTLFKARPSGLADFFLLSRRFRSRLPSRMIIYAQFVGLSVVCLCVPFFVALSLLPTTALQPARNLPLHLTHPPPSFPLQQSKLPLPPCFTLNRSRPR